MIKAVIFDMWQTVIYSDWGFGNKVINALGLTLEKEEELWLLLERDWMRRRFKTFRESAKHACLALGIKDPEKIMEFARLYEEDRKHIKPYKDVLPALRKLRKKYKTGLLSNTENFALPILEKSGFLKNFDAAFFSCDHKTLKPDKKFFKAILTALDVRPEETVMIGDSVRNDITPAKQLGMHAILLDRHNKHPEMADRITSLAYLDRKLEKLSSAENL